MTAKTIALHVTRRGLPAAAALVAAAHGPATADAGMEIPVRHIVLLGDSIFDNAAYVPGGPDVVQQLRERLPNGWRATLGTVDGSVTTSVARPLHQLPPDASHLIVSVGGNDALGHADILDEGARSMAEALDRMAGIGDQFEQDYGAMLETRP